MLRDRSTANNGTINERRYAMQDGNWNTVAICDITGSVVERYAYSAFGTPVFMTGAGVVQSASPIGFERLYAVRGVSMGWCAAAGVLRQESIPAADDWHVESQRSARVCRWNEYRDINLPDESFSS